MCYKTFLVSRSIPNTDTFEHNAMSIYAITRYTHQARLRFYITKLNRKGSDGDFIRHLENVEVWKKLARRISGSMMKRFGDGGGGGGGVVYQSDGIEVACLRSRRWMGNKAIAPPTKSEQNRSRCNCRSRGGGIVETIIEPRRDGVCAVCNSVPELPYLLVIASEAITLRRKNSVGGHGLEYSVIQRDACSVYVYTRVSL